MTSKRLYLVFLCLIGICLVAFVGGAYGINKMLTTKADNLTTLKAKSLALDQEQLNLAKAKKDTTTYADLYKITKSVVPEDKDQAEAVREIVNIAAANGVNLASITFPPSTLGGTAVASGTTTSGVSQSAPASAASGSSKAGSLSQLIPVKNIAGVYGLPITVQSDSNHPVQYSKFVNFLGALEHNRRTAQVSNISIQPNTQDSSVLTFTLNLTEYIKP